AGLSAAQGVWAPTLRHVRGRFYVAYAVATGLEWPAMFKNYYVSADSIEGPWSEPVFVADGGIDPDLFEDVDGRVYFSYKCAETAPIDLGTGKLLAPFRQLWQGTRDAYAEATHLYRIGEYYYVMLAQGGTGPGHSVTMARARSFDGPFEPCPWNPVLTHRGTSRRVQSVGHADLLQSASGDWFAVCLGVRDVNGISPLGRETYLMPVEWRDGWPVFGEKGRMADLESLTAPAPMPRDLHDDFETPEAPLFWNTRLGWGGDTVVRGGGSLRLFPNGRTLESDAEMAWLGVRQPDFNAAAEIVLHPETLAADQTAGLCVYVSPRYHLTLQLRKDDGDLVIESILRAGETKALLARETLADASPHRLRIESAARDAHGSIQGAYLLRHAPADGADGAADAAEFARSDLRLFGGTVTGTGFTGAFFACFAEGGSGAGGGVAFSDFRLKAGV
ncbi:MAG: family 43 glycosylhydrolase, partial [Verrucomicrobiota bacterium]